jgi:hypothetical protein
VKNPDRFKSLHKLTSKDREDIYRYAMKRSDEILAGDDDTNITSKGWEERDKLTDAAKRYCASCGRKETQNHPLFWCDGDWYCPAACQVITKPVETEHVHVKRPKPPLFRKYEYDLFKLLSRLHMSAMGSSDPLPDDLIGPYIAEVRNRLRYWTPSTPRSKPYDDAVKAMCHAVLAEYD